MSPASPRGGSGPRFPEPRIGDAEREGAVWALSEHFTAGRLSQDEFEERTGVAWRARTHSDLAPLFGDLPLPHGRPAAAPAVQVPAVPPPPARRRIPWLPVVMLLLAVALMSDNFFMAVVLIVLAAAVVSRHGPRSRRASPPRYGSHGAHRPRRPN